MNYHLMFFFIQSCSCLLIYYSLLFNKKDLNFYLSLQFIYLRIVFLIRAFVLNSLTSSDNIVSTIKNKQYCEISYLVVIIDLMRFIYTIAKALFLWLLRI